MNARQSSGFLPQLLNSVSEDRLDAFLNDLHCRMQEEMDGRRLLLWKKGRTIRGINRLGFITSLPRTLIHALNASEDFVIDGDFVNKKRVELP